MISKNHQPKAEHKRWHDWLAQLPCSECAARPVQVHHAVGASAKHNKIWIGQYWCISLCAHCHQYLHAGGHLNSMPRKTFEKAMFEALWPRYERETGNAIPQQVVTAIMEYQK